MKIRGKRDRWIDIVFFLLLLLAAGWVTFRLFSLQTLYAVAGLEEYPSDMLAYIREIQGVGSKYSFPYPVFFKLAALFQLFVGAESAVAVATLILNCLSMVLIKAALEYLTGKKMRQRFAGKEWIAGGIISLVAVSLHFISMLFPPEGMYLRGIRFRYLGVFTPNPFHNATYMATRPFGILAFLWFVKLLPVYEKGIRDKRAIRDYVLFAVFLLLTTMTKPSFTIVLVAAAGLIMVYRLIRARFKNFVPTLQLGVCFIPTFIDLLYQYQGVFVPKEPGQEGGIGFCLGSVWMLYCDNIPLAIGLACGFPILVTLIHWRELKTDGLFRFSWQIWLISFGMAFFLYEKGFRMPDFNFSWGYMHGIYFLFFGALVVLLKATAQKKNPPWLLLLQWLAYAWHAACGLYYFWTMFQGGTYY